MRGSVLAAVVGLLMLAGCGNAQRVERPLGDVHASLLSMAADDHVMDLATTFPGTGYYLQPDGARLVWHFTHDGKDYGRFVATLAEDGPNATQVSTHFEDASDAPLAAKLDFLRKMARMAGEASVTAALTGRPVDRAALQQEFQQLVVNNPMAAQVAAIETVSSEMDRLAPPDPCDSDNWKTRQRCEALERNRESSGSSTFE